ACELPAGDDAACPESQSCADSGGQGVCRLDQGAAAGEACDGGLSSCRRGLQCVGGVCQSFCEPDAAAGAPGSCPSVSGAEAVCVPLRLSNGMVSPFGACVVPECDPGATPTGCAQGEVCVGPSV